MVNKENEEQDDDKKEELDSSLPQDEFEEAILDFYEPQNQFSHPDSPQYDDEFDSDDEGEEEVNADAETDEAHEGEEEGDADAETDEAHEGEEEIRPEEDVVIQINTELFFGENDETILARMLEFNENLNREQILGIITNIRRNFSGSGEHFRDEEYKKILQLIYPDQELFDNLYEGLEQEYRALSENETLSKEEIESIVNEIHELFPHLSELNTSLDEE